MIRLKILIIINLYKNIVGNICFYISEIWWVEISSNNLSINVIGKYIIELSYEETVWIIILK